MCKRDLEPLSDTVWSTWLLTHSWHLHHPSACAFDSSVHEVSLQVLHPVLLHTLWTLEDQIAKPEIDTQTARVRDRREQGVVSETRKGNY